MRSSVLGGSVPDFGRRGCCQLGFRTCRNSMGPIGLSEGCLRCSRLCFEILDAQGFTVGSSQVSKRL